MVLFVTTHCWTHHKEFLSRHNPDINATGQLVIASVLVTSLALTAPGKSAPRLMAEYATVREFAILQPTTRRQAAPQDMDQEVREISLTLKERSTTLHLLSQTVQHNLQWQGSYPMGRVETLIGRAGNPGKSMVYALVAGLFMVSIVP